MQTQTLSQNLRSAGCPKRLVTDRTYLKGEERMALKPASMRVRQIAETRPENVLQKDTIIWHTKAGDSVQ